ncbi:TetR/AcrR family transcriptional regulator [Arcobacter cloacae]|uniref:TetR family transcriptional regulator n=1 Tax=Arcobacter cloacae TaxID=1054034 RepID=A0A6M8NLI2_9BACT|nr:TetR/AcrR family transcriptional regulator [Arcobacter cloacae]QKF89227.1 transcriptional regulator, TetR/AcrR family [Arcobacter cloacae]RXI42582.1 TetR family transcriptional regulator [Arcobacter cloacae]
MPKIVNSSEKIDFICEKAYEEFIKNGVNNFSLNKFIESLNMSKGQFYHYFKTKEELIFEVIDKKSEKFFIDTEKKINEAQTFSQKLLALFSFYLVLSDPENKSFDKLMKDTFYMYLNIENEFIKQKNAECYDYLFSSTNEIFNEMIAKKTLNENAKKFIPSLIATADGMYLQSITLENYNLKENLIDYIKMLEDLLKR